MAKTEEKFVNKKYQARSERERRQVRIINSVAIGILAVVVGLVIFAFVNEFIIKPSRAVATVGSEKVTLAEYQARVRYSRYQALSQMAQYTELKSTLFTDESSSQYIDSLISQLQSQLDAPETLGRSVLNQLIDEAVIKQEAAKLGITVTSQEVDALLQESYGYYPNGTPTPTITPTLVLTPTLSAEQLAFLRPTATLEPTATLDPAAPTAEPTIAPTLEPTIAPTEGPAPTAEATATPLPSPTAYTLQAYQDLLSKQLDTYKKFKFRESDLRSVASNYLLRDKLFAEITKDQKPEQDQIWTRHILVATEEEAQLVYQRLIKVGEDWFTVAAESSTDATTRDTGGDMGWLGAGSTYEEYETAAKALKIGEISQPVETAAGWHVIQLLGHEVRPLTSSQFTTAKETFFTEWLSAKNTELGVKYNDDLWKNNTPEEPYSLVLE